MGGQETASDGSDSSVWDSADNLRLGANGAARAKDHDGCLVKSVCGRVDAGCYGAGPYLGLQGGCAEHKRNTLSSHLHVVFLSSISYFALHIKTYPLCCGTSANSKAPMGLTLPVLPKYLPFSTHGPTFHLLTVMKMKVPVAHGMRTASVDQFILTGTYADHMAVVHVHRQRASNF